MGCMLHHICMLCGHMLAVSHAGCSTSNISLVHSNRQVIFFTSIKTSEGIAQGHHCLTHHHAIHHHAVTMLCCCTNHHATAIRSYCCASTGWAGLTTDLATTARHSCGLWGIKPPGKMEQQGPSTVTFWMEVKRGLSLLCPWCHHELRKQHT